MEMGPELAFIVEHLNNPPFSMMLTMVAFDEKTPFELLEVVNEVMAQLSSQHRVDLRDETPEATATRMLDFLRVLNYAGTKNLDPQVAKQALLHGELGMIYPILAWMLGRLPDLQKRAYLGKFLVNVDVPEHMFTDEEIVEVYQSYKDLQEEFKEVHRTSEKYKSQLISPNEIKRAIMQMEEDRSQLEVSPCALRPALRSLPSALRPPPSALRPPRHTHTRQPTPHSTPLHGERSVDAAHHVHLALCACATPTRPTLPSPPRHPPTPIRPPSLPPSHPAPCYPNRPSPTPHHTCRPWA